MKSSLFRDNLVCCAPPGLSSHGETETIMLYSMLLIFVTQLNKITFWNLFHLTFHAQRSTFRSRRSPCVIECARRI